MEQGLLDLSVELSTRDITAGKEFAIFVLVKNPFNKPIRIKEVNVSLPSDLHLAGSDNIIQQIKEAESSYTEAIEKTKKERDELRNKLDDLKFTISEFSSDYQNIDSEDESQSRTNSLISNLERHLDYYTVKKMIQAF